MSVIVNGSNRNLPNMEVQDGLTKNDFAALKNVLGERVRKTVVTWLTESWWSEQNQTGKKDETSKNIIKVKIVLNEKTKETVKFDFYADKVVSRNVPDDYKETLKELSKTEAVVHKVIAEICIELLTEKKNSKYGTMIKDAEHIKSLKDSAIIKVATYIAMQEKLWDDPEMAHLTDEKFLKMW